MSPDEVIAIMRHTIQMAFMVAAPLLGAGMAVGLLVAIFQAATQVQESSLSFVPKLVAMGGVLVVGGPWLLDRLLLFTTEVIEGVALLGPGVGP